jgi:holliday junction DNA helicase RuvA
MIGRIEGQLVEIEDNVILLAAGGVGYEIEVSSNVLAALPGRGSQMRLHTHFVVREDAQLLYGFASRSERDLFRVLLKMTGFGPKLALAVVSSVSLHELAESVRDNDVNALLRVSGIGRKKAERLLLDLQGKLPETPAQTQAPVGTARAGSRAVAEAEGALVTLGYRPAEAARLIASIKTEAETTEELVRAALRHVARQTEPAS